MFPSCSAISVIVCFTLGGLCNAQYRRDVKNIVLFEGKHAEQEDALRRGNTLYEERPAAVNLYQPLMSICMHRMKKSR